MEYDFKLTMDEANAVVQGLAKLPYEASYQVIAKIQQQYQQQAPKQEAAEDQQEILQE